MEFVRKTEGHFSPPFRPAKRTTFMFNGKTYPACLLEVNGRHVKKIGINPDHYMEGLKTYILETGSFSRFCRDLGYEEDGIKGIYPFGRSSAQHEVVFGSTERLPIKDRITILREGYGKRELVHETLHDIFLGCFGKDARNQFYRCVGDWFLRIKKSDKIEEEEFFKKAGRGLTYQFEPKLIRQWDFASAFRENLFPREFRLFAMECFADAGWLIIAGEGKKKHLGQIPVEIVNYFKERRSLI